MNPLGIFLSHEMAKFNNLLKTIRSMLAELQRALKGLVVMSAQLDAAYANFLFQQVPAPWGENGKGYPSLKPLASWFRDLLARVAFMSGWLKGGTIRTGADASVLNSTLPPPTSGELTPMPDANLYRRVGGAATATCDLYVKVHLKAQ